MFQVIATSNQEEGIVTEVWEFKTIQEAVTKAFACYWGFYNTVKVTKK